MPLVEEFGLNQRAIFWEATAPDNYGQVQVKAPIEINVRWSGTRSNPRAPMEEAVAVDLTVFVDRPISTGSILKEGKLEELGASVTDLYQVVKYSKFLDVKGRNAAHTVGLKAFPDALPTIIS